MQYRRKKKLLSDANLGVFDTRSKDCDVRAFFYHEPRKPLSLQLLERSGPTDALIQQWEER
jgi:hypothetical protein